MIHVDIDKEEVEFEGNGEKMISEIALVLCLSIYRHFEEHKEMTPSDAIAMSELITSAIGATVKEAIRMRFEEGDEEDDEFEEEGNLSEERGVETIHTTVKQFRRRRPS